MTKKDYNERAVVKCKLKDILYNNYTYNNFYKIINKTNVLISNCYLFMRSFLIYSYDNNIKNFSVDLSFIRCAFKVLSINNNKGRKISKNNNIILEHLKKYHKEFQDLTKIKNIDASNTSYIIGQMIEQIYISIINNIQYNYFKYVKRYVRLYFDKHFNETQLNSSKKNKIINDIFEDIILNTRNCDKKYRPFINDTINNFIPKTFTEPKFERDINENTLDYLFSMIKFNLYFENNNNKTYQFFPIRKTCYPKYIKINTSALIDIFCEKNKLEMFSKAGNNIFQEEIWNKYFDLKDKKGKYRYLLNNYEFNYEIQTDGFAVSINLIHKNEIDKKNLKKKHMKEGRNKTNQIKKESITEYEKAVNEKKNTELEKIEKNKNRQKEQTKMNKIKYNQLSEKEKEKIKYEKNLKSEFPLVDTLLKSQLGRLDFEKYLNDKNLCVADPGKRTLLYMLNINGADKKLNLSKTHKVRLQNEKNNNFGIRTYKTHKIMNYTNKTRVRFLKRLKYGQLIDNKKRKTKIKSGKTIKQLEEELSKYNSKSCIYNKFIDYVKNKKIFDKSINSYEIKNYYRKLNWFSYINKIKHENMLVRQIRQHFGRDIKLVIGNWGGNNKIKYMSTPNIGLKRRLGNDFDIYTIDEYNTSKIHFKHEIKCENLKIKKPEINTEEKNKKKQLKKEIIETE